MNTLNMSEDDIKSTLRVVSAVLHFGNMEFKKERGSDQATMPDNTVAQKVCQLLKLDVNSFTRALLRPKVKVIDIANFEKIGSILTLGWTRICDKSSVQRRCRLCC